MCVVFCLAMDAWCVHNTQTLIHTNNKSIHKQLNRISVEALKLYCIVSVFFSLFAATNSDHNEIIWNFNHFSCIEILKIKLISRTDFFYSFPFKKKIILTSAMVIENIWCRQCKFQMVFFFFCYFLFTLILIWKRHLGHTPTKRLRTVFLIQSQNVIQKKIIGSFCWCSAHLISGFFCSYSCSLIVSLSTITK